MALTPLSEDQIAARLVLLDGWQRTDNTIHKTVLLDSYMAGLAFAAAVGTICEGLNHHPDMMTIGYKRVTIVFTTHDAGGILTDNDFDAAEAIDRLGYPRRA